MIATKQKELSYEQISRMLKNKNMLNLDSNIRKYIKDFSNDRTAMIS